MGDWMGVVRDEVCTGVVAPGGSMVAKGDADADETGGSDEDVLFCCCCCCSPLLPPSPAALLARNSLVSFKKVLESLVD